MRPAALPLLVCLGCTVGEGMGAASGHLYIRECTPAEKGSTGDIGALEAPAPFDLKPGFFAAEPLDDIRSEGRQNRLVIRLQERGRRTEASDVLTIDIVSVYEVARCLRGAMVDGKPDFTPSFCHWPAAGPARMRVGASFPIRAYFVPRSTCPNELRLPLTVASTAVATARASASGGPESWESWIEWEQLGPVSSQRQGVAVSPTFKIGFGDRLHARAFHLNMVDDRVLKTAARGETPPAPDITATFDGYFTFTVERGQGGQSFP